MNVRLLGTRFAMLLGLTGLAITQPLLNTLSSSPATFEFYSFESGDIVVFALLLAFVPPVVLWSIETAAHFINKPLGVWVHLAFSGALFTLFVQQLLIQIGLDAAVLAWLMSIAAGMGIVLALLRSSAVSSWLALMGVLPVVTVLLFLFSAPIVDLVNPPDRQEVVAAPERSEPPPSVIMILLDELATQSIMNSDEEIDATRFPNLAEFAADATWYQNSTTMSPFTRTAVPSILAGVEPSEEGKRSNWIDYPDNLFRLLGGSHHLTVSESVTNLCGVEGCTAVPNPPPPVDGSPTEVVAATKSGGDANFASMWDTTFDVLKERLAPTSSGEDPLDDFEESVESLRSEGAASSESTEAKPLEEFGSPKIENDGPDKRFANQPSRLIDFVDAIRASSKPTLYFLHLVLPHQPWRYDVDGTEYLLPSGPAKPGGSGSSGQWLANTVRQRHLIQASYADALLGEILDKTKAEGIYDDSLVIVLADHGVAFEPGFPSRQVVSETRAGVAYAPLLIKSPGQSAGSVSDTNATIVDVLPTIASELDVTIPWEVDGVDLASAGATERGSIKRIYDWIHEPKRYLRGVVD
ncbi:MAG: sulfatase-like hydrolase/transferase, partial [Acidobacteria bacterium]|nr:sulfatase-like hydrolase/transferase [Acidobacteriota bacterium]